MTELFNKVRYNYTCNIICFFSSAFITHTHYGIRTLNYFFALINITAYAMQSHAIHLARIIHYFLPRI